MNSVKPTVLLLLLMMMLLLLLLLLLLLCCCCCYVVVVVVVVVVCNLVRRLIWRGGHLWSDGNLRVYGLLKKSTVVTVMLLLFVT